VRRQTHLEKMRFTTRSMTAYNAEIAEQFEVAAGA
jgi:hypothetical protein